MEDLPKYLAEKFILIDCQFTGITRIDPNAINAYWDSESERACVIRLACGAELLTKCSADVLDHILEAWFEHGDPTG